MKKDIHPKRRLVIFYDASASKQFLLRSGAHTDKKAIYEGDSKEYPIINIDVSSASHPVYTGQSRSHGQEGRVARFNNKFGGHNFLA